MKKENKILFTCIVVVLVILALFTVVIEYQFGLFSKADEEDLPLLVKIFAPANSGTIPFEVNFTSLALYYEGNINYHWDFGDNETSNEMKPSHIYNESGLYVCTLTITDGSGQTTSDQFEILIKAGQVPTVSIVMDDLKPSRPFIPIIWHKQMSQFYNGQKLRRLIDSKFFPSSLLNLEGFVTCNAAASSPQGNEIVSYGWELRAPSYTSIAGQQRKPMYTFEGKNITIPLLYTYPQAQYDLTVIVTDSEGFTGSSTIKFDVELSPTVTQIQSIQTSIDLFRKNVWHDILKESLSGSVGSLIYQTAFSKLPSWPLLKLGIVLQLGTKWAINPEGTLSIELLGQFLEKHPRLQNVLQKNLVRIQSLLEKKVGESARLASLYEKVIDAIQGLLEQLGLANLKPEISDEKPENNAQLVNASIPQVSITVTDTEGDPFNVSIHGKYLNDTLFTNQYNNTFNATFFSTLPYETDIYWHVNVSSQGRWVNRTYMFTTRWS